MAVIWHATAGPIRARTRRAERLAGAALRDQGEPRGRHRAAPGVVLPVPVRASADLQEPWQLIFATIIIPTILMVLLIAWPFLDTGRDRRLSRRPAGVALGLATPAVLIALTIARRCAWRRPALPSPATPRSTSCGRRVHPGRYGCTTCHNFGGGGGDIGPSLANGRMFGNDPAQIKSLGRETRGGVMPAFKGKILRQPRSRRSRLHRRPQEPLFKTAPAGRLPQPCESCSASPEPPARPTPRASSARWSRPAPTSAWSPRRPAPQVVALELYGDRDMDPDRRDRAVRGRERRPERAVWGGRD